MGAVPIGGEVRVNDVTIGEIAAKNGEQEATLTVPAACMAGRYRMRLEFRMGAMAHPTDKRELCVYPRTIRLKRLDGKGNELVLGIDIDAAKLRQAVRRVGQGCVVPVPWDGDAVFMYGSLVTMLLRTPALISGDLPVCALPDAKADGVFISLREGEVLVFNENDAPVRLDLMIPAGAELERGVFAGGSDYRGLELQPHTILSRPLSLRRARQ